MMRLCRIWEGEEGAGVGILLRALESLIIIMIKMIMINIILMMIKLIMMAMMMTMTMTCRRIKGACSIRRASSQ